MGGSMQSGGGSSRCLLTKPALRRARSESLRRWAAHIRRLGVMLSLMLVAVFVRFAWRGVVAAVVLFGATAAASFAHQQHLVRRAHRACTGVPVMAHVELHPLVVPGPSGWVQFLAPKSTTALRHQNRHPRVAAVFQLPGHPTLQLDVGFMKDELHGWSGTCRLHGDIGEGGVVLIEHPILGLMSPTRRRKRLGHAPFGRWSPVVRRDPQPEESVG